MKESLFKKFWCSPDPQAAELALSRDVLESFRERGCLESVGEVEVSHRIRIQK